MTEQQQTPTNWQRWSHWPAGVVMGALAFALVALLTRSVLLAAVVGALLAFLVHGETRRYVRRHLRRPVHGRPWLASPAIRRRAIVVVGLAVVVVWYAVGIALEDVSPGTIRNLVQGWGAWGPILLIVLSGLGMLVAPIPNAPLAIAAGILWGTWLGTLYALLGQLLGATLGFYAVRFLGRRYLPRLVGPAAAARIDELSLSMGAHVVFWTRTAPFIPIDFTAYAAGLTALRYRTFIAAFMLGAIVPTWLIVWFGDSLTQSWRMQVVSFGLLIIALLAITIVYAVLNRQTLPPRSRWLDWRAWLRALMQAPPPSRDAKAPRSPRGQAE